VAKTELQESTHLIGRLDIGPGQHGPVLHESGVIPARALQHRHGSQVLVPVLSVCLITHITKWESYTSVETMGWDGRDGVHTVEADIM
jgi:hypothetical protein